jgi:chromosome segregation ATPase
MTVNKLKEKYEDLKKFVQEDEDKVTARKDQIGQIQKEVDLLEAGLEGSRKQMDEVKSQIITIMTAEA